MTQYGPMIQFDTSTTPITMSVADEVLPSVKAIFEQNYRLPITSIVQGEGESTFTFDDSVSAEVFLRHLKTATPEEYTAAPAE